MSYTCRITHGDEIVEEEEFDTREEADAWGLEWLSLSSEGADVLEDAGEDYIDPDEFDYEID